MIAPKAFKGKDKDAEALLIDFDLYVKTVKNFFVATGKDSATDKQKVALLQAVGGPDMVDLVEDVGKVILVSTPARTGVEAVVADTFEQAISKIREGIVGKTNQAMSRLKLFQQMGQGTQHRSSAPGTRKCSSRLRGVTGPPTTRRRRQETPSCIRHLTRS